jgi:spore coat polysaccharide biosynthesis protein SpsF (cytidylyltransferase family)
VDSNRCCDIDDRKSISEYAFFIGGTIFTWLLKKQSTVTLSTYKAEYVAASLGMSPAIWLRRLLQELKSSQLESIEVRVDNKSAIELAKNLVHHETRKYIDVRFHLIREHIKDGEVQVIYM